MHASDVILTLADLVRINSVNPSYDGGQPEAEIANFIARFFAERGIETREQEVAPGRPNLIARLPGRTTRRLVFEAHMDTASVNGMSIPPFEPSISGGRLYGRGACDTKAGLAAMMEALAAVKRDGIVPPCEIWVVAAADEEFSFKGVLKLREGLEAAAAVVSEPTEMRLVIASKGVLRWRICCRGKAAHSAKPHLGVNAIMNMARLLLILEEDNRSLLSKANALVGNPTFNTGVIKGGDQVNFVPDHCSIEIDRRLIPGEDIGEVRAHYGRLIEAHPELDAYMEPSMLEDYPLETAPDAPIAACARAVLKDLGLDDEPAGVPFGSDASKLSHGGTPSILFGPGSIDQAHSAVEYVDCEQVRQAVAFYRGIMTQFALNTTSTGW
ncbi:MAG: ArgE/DapE family deacylase [Bryobacteraceae bacterium]